MNNDIAIKVEGVSKAFKLPHNRQSSIKGTLINLLGKGDRTFETQEVLKDISFEIKKGEFFGIVGRNGSGKSTLLKMLAGIYTPTKGGITINGTLTPFIELGVGFNPELTGRENVYLNGALLGFDNNDVDQMYDDIVAFAELERFMDQKLKNYSSGMQVRLAFSIAIRANTDILLLDEVLAVGDLEFQRKCYKYFATLKREQHTVVLVSHDMAAVKKFCTKCVLVHEGKFIYSGAPNKVAEKYEELNSVSSEPTPDVRMADQANGPMKFKGIETFNVATGNKINHFNSHERIGVRIVATADQDVQGPTIGFIFQDEVGATVFATNNWTAGVKTGKIRAGERIVYETSVDNVFTNGSYTITAALEDADIIDSYDRWDRVSSFTISGHEFAHASTHPAYTTSMHKTSV